MADELLDLVDEYNNLTGETKMKLVAHADGSWHRAAHVWIYTSDGKLLLQHRAKEKPLYPDRWDISATGHVSAGEDVIVSALREIEEEIGLSVCASDLEFIQIKKVKSVYKDIINNEFYYTYLLKFDGSINDLQMQVEEVQGLEFLSLDDLQIQLKSNPEKFVPHGVLWFDIIEEVKQRL
jgi:isopentenyl-diphosphate Delta-isomerase